MFVKTTCARRRHPVSHSQGHHVVYVDVRKEKLLGRRHMHTTPNVISVPFISLKLVARLKIRTDIQTNRDNRTGG